MEGREAGLGALPRQAAEIGTDQGDIPCANEGGLHAHVCL